MIRLSGYKLSEKQKALNSLSKIFGIGKNKAKQIICLLGLKNNDNLLKIDYLQKIMLDKIIIHYIHAHKLRRLKKNKIIFLKENRSYRGIRHSYFLPVRGQRTKTNARTQKNKKIKKSKVK